jgi:hypothetical protein
MSETLYAALQKYWNDPEKVAKRMDAVRAAVARPVLCVQTGAVFPMIKDAVIWLRSIGFERSTESMITAACRGRRKSSQGFTWQYVANP